MNSPTHAPAHVQPEDEWCAIVEGTPVACRQLVAETVRTNSQALATFFYGSMMPHPKATQFLGHDIVQKRLMGSMQRWLSDVYAEPALDTAAIVAHQRHVGEVHARIQLPMHLVARGARLLKHELFAHLHRTGTEPDVLRTAMAYAGQLMDLALELMTESYLRDSQRGARNDEAYRLHSLGQNMAVERERQRSVLLEWVQEVLFALYREAPTPNRQLPRLAHSEFGLWFHHKAAAVFEGAPELGIIHDIMEQIDGSILPQIGPTADTTRLVMELQAALENLKFQLTTLFERQLEVENGRDALTRLLNRRYLPAVLNREIRLAQASKTRFAILLLDLDHFKSVNDAYGHDAGDSVLQQSAALVLNSVRNGDFVFRYGGEELLVMLVEVTAESALRVAEGLRERFAQTEFLIGQGRHIQITTSIGVALYDGHPDHQYLVNLADQALYQAKRLGRDRVCVANLESAAA